MRSAATAARGIIIDIIVAIITAMRIWMRYWRNAVSEPICVVPASMPAAPNHRTATDVTFMMSMTIGKTSAKSRPARSAVSARSPLAPAKRVASWRSRTNARITRMPVSCSRSTRLTTSIRACMLRNSGSIRTTMNPMATSRIGTDTAMSQESPTSCCRARMTPPIAMIGAVTMSAKTMNTSVWTCWTSFVVRVMRVAAPNLPTSRSENSATWSKIRSRMSRPRRIAARAPNHTAPIADAIWTTVIPSMMPPVPMITSMFPCATPSSIIVALRLGRRRFAIVWTSCSASVATTIQV